METHKVLRDFFSGPVLGCGRVEWCSGEGVLEEQRERWRAEWRMYLRI
jgi:hypothetical protein